MITPMIILAILIAPLLIESIRAWVQQRCIRLDSSILYGLVMAFGFFVLGHFVKTEGMIAMLPNWVPFKTAVIYITGIWEILLAVGMLSKTYRNWALKLAAFTLVLFFTSNIYAALNYTGLGGHQWGPVYLLVRTPLQLLLVGWCLWAYWLAGRELKK